MKSLGSEIPHYFQQTIVYRNVIFMTILHLGAIYGLWLFLTFQTKWPTIFMTSLMIWLNGEGITIGAHRLWSHRSFKGNLMLRIILMILFTMSGQNSIYTWARDHRLHHKYSDTDADPHNTKRGLFFSHMGWLLLRKHPEVLKKGKNIDMTDLEADPVVTFQHRYFFPLFFLCALIIPVALPILLYNETLKNSIFTMFFYRYTYSLHATWTVNSLAHAFGMRPFTKNIDPAENLLVSIITYGEGWHNYHHTFPWDYRASDSGVPFNASASIIKFFEKIGWARDLKFATPEMIAYRIAHHGDPDVLKRSQRGRPN